jgi:hypothetical protein
MSHATAPEASFDAIAARLLADPEVERGTGFGTRPGLRAGGRIFAMLIDDDLVVKLPADRCAELVATGSARPFDRGQGRPLKEWVRIAHAGSIDWRAIADEAHAFVRR